jgi:glycosyltransferase involved in cell wall biosynthesis
MEGNNMTHDLLVFGEDWGGLPSSTQHLISHLSNHHKTVWINSIGLRRPRICRHDIKRMWHKMTSGNHVVSDQPVLPNDNFHIVNPKTIPAPHYKLERRIASRLIAAQVKPVIKKAALRSPILWMSLPTAIDVADNIDHAALIYYCGDDFSSLAGVDHETVRQHEQKLVEKADLIIAASDTLAAHFPAEKTRILPHGVNYPLFSTPTERAKDLVNDGRPIAGFYGSISKWLDLDLLTQTITRLPDWHFVFIGAAVIDVNALNQFDNVTFLGERAHELLPSYVQHWTACLLPFINNQQIQHCNPLKLREYLASGRPVISTEFPALAPYLAFVTTVKSVDEMVLALTNAIPKDINCHQQLAVSNQTWSSQADKVSMWLDRL